MGEPKRCTYPKCKLLAEEGSDLCILHQPSPEESPKDIERFKEVLYAQLDEEGPEDERNRRLWFEGYVFPEAVIVRGTWDEESDGPVVLPVRMGAAVFRGAKFEKRANFSDAKFEKRASFSDAKFEKRASFSYAKFEELADFSGAKFSWAIFSDAKFEELADFRGATFALADFSDAKFSWAIFSDAKFEKRANFSDAKFSWAYFRGATFAGAIFGGATFEEALFRGAKFEFGADFSDAKFSWASFSDAKFEKLASFSDAKFEKRADFRGATFAGAHFNDATFAEALFRGAKFEFGADFSGATFAEAADFFATEARVLYLGTGNPQIRGWGHARCGVRLEDCSSAPSFWRFAQRTYSAIGEREKADAAFYFARVAERKAQRAVDWPSHEGIRWCGWVPWLMKCLLSMIPKAWPTFVWAVECVFVRWTTAYGASLARLFITWAFAVGSFGAAYSLAPSLIGNGPKIWSWDNWIVGLHFSVTTFTTLGLGDPKPLRLAARVLTSAEAILGAVLVALAVLVIGRRYMRQS